MPLLSTAAGRIRRATSCALDLLFPPRCVGCDAELGEDHGSVMLCGDCRAALPLAEWPACVRCAAPVPVANSVALPCSHCRDRKLRFDRTLALGAYDGLLRRLVMRMKTERSELTCRTLIEVGWQEMQAALCGLNADVATAVPMHPWRHWRRGTNPPATLARGLADKLGIAAAGRLLRLKRNVPPQVGLTRPARFRNLAGEMAVRRTYHLQGARVLLVDDILTTGATCTEAARVLRRAGAAEITVFVLARTLTDP